MQLPVENIIELIPQKPPFVMIDKLLETNDISTKSSFRIKGDNVFVKGGVFQEAGLLENIAQTAALRAGYQAAEQNKPIKSGYIGAVKDFEIFALPKLNDEIITTVNMENQVFGVSVFTGEARCCETLLARCEMKVFSTNQA